MNSTITRLISHRRLFVAAARLPPAPPRRLFSTSFHRASRTEPRLAPRDGAPVLPMFGNIQEQIQYLIVKVTELNKAVASLTIHMKYLTSGVGILFAGVTGVSRYISICEVDNHQF
ncbi:hypothetical protein ABW21_db0207670 [Orbilia brochopaga]|nr:hypothetical protein ABW21_db0207670 [Drechslerella brochopaga]